MLPADKDGIRRPPGQIEAASKNHLEKQNGGGQDKLVAETLSQQNLTTALNYVAVSMS
jgi:hypothetical protein